MARYVSNNRLYQIPPDVKIKSSVENSYLNRMDLSVELPKQMERVCPCCGSHNCVIKDSGRNRTVRHVPASNRSVFITFHQRRFRCKECGSSFYEPADWIHDRLHMTNTLVVDICLQLTDMVSIQSIAKKELIPDDVVLSVFDIITIAPPKSLPQVMCVDEFKGDTGVYDPKTKRWVTNKFQCNITDGKARVLIDVLPVISKEYLISYFMSYPKEERCKVKYFCCDMHSGFVTVARKCFPGAVICIDTFHVVNRLNKAMDDIRRRIQNGLESEEETNGPQKSVKQLKDSAYILKTKEASKSKKWGTDFSKKQARLDCILELYPDICEMYDRLQEFLLIIDMDSYALQRVNLTDWLHRALPSEVLEIQSAANTLQHWRGYIQNTWKSGYTNGVAEGLNNKIKILKRISYGLRSFENLRKRLLLVCSTIHLNQSPAGTLHQVLSEKKGAIRL